MDIHLHALVPLRMPVWTQGLVVLGVWAVPYLSLLPCLWGVPIPSLRAGCAGHFGGKYKKPSSGQLEGVGFSSKV